jgi:hypothetical protein
MKNEFSSMFIIFGYQFIDFLLENARKLNSFYGIMPASFNVSQYRIFFHCKLKIPERFLFIIITSSVGALHYFLCAKIT